MNIKININIATSYIEVFGHRLICVHFHEEITPHDAHADKVYQGIRDSSIYNFLGLPK